MARVLQAETFQLVQFDPTLLSCAKKRGVEPPRRNCPKETLGNGFLWTPSETEGRGPSGTRAARYRRLYRLGVLRTFERSVVGGTTNLADPTRRKANFLWKFLCAGTSPSAMRSPVPHRSPPARIFAEQKCLAADKVSQICCSAGRSSAILQTSKAVHTRKRVLPKYVGDARLVWHCKSGTPGISKGSKPFCIYAQA